MIASIPAVYFSNTKITEANTKTKGMILLYLEMKKYEQCKRKDCENLYSVTLDELVSLFCDPRYNKGDTYQKYLKDVRYSLDDIIKTTNWQIDRYYPVDIKKIRTHRKIILTYYFNSNYLSKQMSYFSYKQYKILMKPQYRHMRIKMLRVIAYITSNWVKISPNYYKFKVSVQAIQNFTGIPESTIRKIIKIFIEEKIIERKKKTYWDINKYKQGVNVSKYVYGTNIYYLKLYFHTSSYSHKTKKYKRKEKKQGSV